MNSNSSYHPEILKSKTNRQFFTPCNLEIWPITLKNNKVPLLCYFKLCASFQNHQCIQTGVTVRKHSIWVKICDFFVLCDLEFRQMTLKNNRAPVLCYFELCASFQNHQWIQTGVTVWKHSIRVKIGNLCPVWPWNLMDDIKNSRAPLLCHFKLYTSFHNHQWIQTVNSNSGL